MIKINKKIKTDLLKDMLTTRLLEEEIVKEYPRKEIRCPVHLSIGQEAISAGVSKILKKEDIIFSAHRSHAHYLSKGGSIKGLIGEIYGKQSGCTKGIGGSMHLVDLKAGVLGCVPIVGSTIPIAVGAAWANKLLKKNTMTVVYFGDGATEQGVFYESLNFAKIHKIPILFVCENNFYSIYTNYKKRNSKKNNTKNFASSLGVRSKQCFGNDVEKVMKVTENSVKFIKKYNEPALIEFFTYRIYEHCGPGIDDYLNYRPKKEVAKWKKKCPIKNYKKKLIKKKILSQASIKRLELEIKKKILKIFLSVKKDKFPHKKLLTEHIYAK